MFGHPLDSNKIKCDKNNFTDIFNHIHHDKFSSEPLEDSKNMCIKSMKRWYCQDHKINLSKILDYYTSSKQQIITKYMNVVNIHDEHWIIIVGHLNDSIKDFQPCVYSIDPMNGNDSEIMNVRRFYAKYFGLYNKEYHEESSLCDHDFDEMDIVNDKNYNQPFLSQEENVSKSFLSHHTVDPILLQEDGYNCRVVCLHECVKHYSGAVDVKEYSKISAESKMTHYQLCILSMIKQIYEELNEESYKPISGHIQMNFGDISNKNTITKFKQIHELFNEVI